MVLGEEVFTGGIPLKSDILAKKISFFKSLQEHVQIIGDRVTVNGSVQASTPDDFYTVPNNRIAFMFSISLEQRNNGSITSRNFTLTILGGGPFLFRNVRGGGQDNAMIIYNSPIILKSGETLRLAKNNTDTNHEVNIFVLLYEIPSEVSIQ